MATLKVETREKTGKYAAFDMRKEGCIPGVVYGKSLKENINVKIPLRDFVHMLHSGERVLDLDVAGTPHHVIVKDVQHGTFEHEILHADFRAISETDTLHVSIAIELVGEAKGHDAGGVLEQSEFEVEVECIAKNLPENITLDVTNLNIGDVMYVKDLPALEGLKYRTAKEVAVVSCHMPAGEEAVTEGEEEEDGAATTEPEVINKGKEEEDA